MNRFVFGSACAAAGFAGALAMFSTAQGAGAPAMTAAYRQLDVFGNAFERVRANYVREVDDSELIDAAIEGMVTSLDPHSRYMNAKDFENFQATTVHGAFGGIGIEMTAEDGLIKVVTPIDGSPAARAGIQTGDYISAVDGMSIEGLPLNQAVEKIMGPENSNVTLTILRQGEKRPFNVTLSRAMIPIASVKSEAKGDVGYVRIAQFTEKTGRDLETAIRNLKRQIGPELKGYVIDLRQNPGGLLDQAVAVSDDFLTGGEVVSTRGRRAQDTERYDAKPGDIADGKPIIVLVNEGSASASEIVAGALQDHRRATIMGMTSFGKGSVQTIIPLGQNSGAISLTTAKYYTPSGRSIQALGITPDIGVSNLTEQDQAIRDQFAQRSEAELPGHFDAEGTLRNNNLPVVRPEPGKKYDDFQLAYAIDRLHGKVVAPVAQAAPATAGTSVQ